MATTAVHILRRRLQAASSLAAACRRCVVNKPTMPTICGDVVYASTPPPPPLLPRRMPLTTKVHGVFINYVDHCRPHLFARPSPTTPSSVDAMLDFLPSDNHRRFWWWVRDHSNGLLLVDFGHELCVCNPATRRWTLVPWPRAAGDDSRFGSGFYLAFDPAVSPDFEVFLVPAAREKKKKADDDDDEEAHRKMEWPPNPWRLHVFSSRTRRWETRTFVRDGEPAGTVQGMLSDPLTPSCCGPEQRYAVYMQGNLYVHCRGAFLARLSLSNERYQVVKTPTYNTEGRFVKPYLGLSEKGVYFGVCQETQIRVWILHESSGRMEWALKHQDDLVHYYGQHVEKYCSHGPWKAHDVSNNNDDDEKEEEEDPVKTLPKTAIEWDSDNDDFVTIKHEDDEGCGNYFDILGFHPHKEVVYLNNLFEVVAYHMNTSKVQYLGYARPKFSYILLYMNGIFSI